MFFGHNGEGETLRYLADTGLRVRDGLVTRTVARIRLTGKMAHDHLVCPPPVSP